MTKQKLAFLPAALCLSLAALSGSASAQTGGSLGPEYAGWTPQSQQGCPPIAYQFRGLSATPVGYVWFRDASGMSKATGTMDLKTGKFQLTVKSLDGNGPAGDVTGDRNPKTGVLTAEFKGSGCSNLTLLPMAPALPQPNG